jgi:non-homologous end joining protein Ku
MHGRQHMFGIKALEGGLMLSILRSADELGDPKPYFEGINFEPESKTIGLAKELIEAESGEFEPEKMSEPFDGDATSNRIPSAAIMILAQALKSRMSVPQVFHV